MPILDKNKEMANYTYSLKLKEAKPIGKVKRRGVDKKSNNEGEIKNCKTCRKNIIETINNLKQNVLFVIM